MVARGRLPLTGNSKGKGPEGRMCFAGSRASRVAMWPQVGPRVGIVGRSEAGAVEAMGDRQALF